MPDPYTLPFVAAAFVLAGVVKGMIGLGLPTVGIGLLSLVMPPAEASALLLGPSLVTNLWQLLAGPHVGPLLRRLRGMMAGIVAGTLAGSGLIAAGSPRTAAALGLALVAYAVLGLTGARPAVPPRAERWAGPLTGLATGVVTGATGVFAIPAVPYLSALGLARDDLVQALGLSFTVSTLALGAGMAWHGAVPLHALGASALALAPAMAGLALGTWLRARVQPELFRQVFLLGLLALGVEFAWRGLA